VVEAETHERGGLGGGRLPYATVVIALALGAVLSSSCGDDDPQRGNTPGAGLTPTLTPVPSPTPDLLGPRPPDATAADTALRRYFGAEPATCTELLVERWQVVCATGELDGDGKPDTAMLVPLAGPGIRSPHPAVVFAWRSSGTTAERFPTAGADGDESPVGRLLFSVVDRTGDSRAELVYLTRRCTASTCNALVEVQSWDGTAWRDLGPADLGMENLDRLDFTGRGAASKLILHGGRVSSIGAGPSRTRTVTYAFDGSRYVAAATEYEKPEYLYHAILDADALVDAGRYEQAIAAYQAAIASKDLKDWKMEAQGEDGRTELVAYALFRIAIATAADAQSPTAALDAVISGTENVLFKRAAQSFRQGFQEGGTVHAGCLSATSYLSSPPNPQALMEMFDYGTVNPRKSALDVCPF
jgi:hypothetical protein